MIMLYDTNSDPSIIKLRDYLQELNDEHKDKQVTYTIEIKLNRPVRSVKANRYYWAVLKCIAVASGYASDELHEYYKKRFNGKYVLEELIGLTTGNLDTKEFTVYVNKVKHHAREFFNAYIPEPEDDKYKAWEMITKNNYDKMFAS